MLCQDVSLNQRSRIKEIGFCPNDEQVSQTSSKAKFFPIHKLWIYDVFEKVLIMNE